MDTAATENGKVARKPVAQATDKARREGREELIGNGRILELPAHEHDGEAKSRGGGERALAKTPFGSQRSSGRQLAEAER